MYPEGFLCCRPGCQGSGCGVLRPLRGDSGKRPLMAPPWVLLYSHLTVYLLFLHTPCHIAMWWEGVQLRGPHQSSAVLFKLLSHQNCDLSSLLYKCLPTPCFVIITQNGLTQINGDGWLLTSIHGNQLWADQGAQQEWMLSLPSLSLGQQCAQTPSFPCWVCICLQPVPSQPHISSGMRLARIARLPFWLSTAPTWDWRAHNAPILLGGLLQTSGSLLLVQPPLDPKQVQNTTKSLSGIVARGSWSGPMLPFLCPTFNLVRATGIQ